MRKKSEMKLGRVWRIRVRILILMRWAGRFSRINAHPYF